MQEIVVSRGKILELLRPDANTGKVHTLLTMEVFGIIRSLMAFRLTGGTKGMSAQLEKLLKLQNEKKKEKKNLFACLQITLSLGVTVVALLSWSTILPKTCLRKSTRKHLERAAVGASSPDSS